MTRMFSVERGALVEMAGEVHLVVDAHCLVSHPGPITVTYLPDRVVQAFPPVREARHGDHA